MRAVTKAQMRYLGGQTRKSPNFYSGIRKDFLEEVTHTRRVRV